MADSKTSALTAASALDGTELLYTSQGGADRKVTPAQIKTYVKTFSGALVKKAADQTGANYTTITAVAWDAESYDDGDWHDNASNNTRLTVPTGVLKVRLTGNIALANSTATFVLISIRKNGVATYDGSATQTTGAFTLISVASPVIEVVAGDYFELFLQVGVDTSLDITANRSSFGIEAVE